ncbi:hypothetical protein [Pseudoxanthomonas sp. GM95]|uniref:hypothetical protein n=1 Tax=Pseudoxanthomonas sp. GM95 TaxID=1881043 RepID=UPI001C31220E|nr:hypothetical protein [Pseudoxanthomonas sp. GM95]
MEIHLAAVNELERRLRQAYAEFHEIDRLKERISAIEAEGECLKQELAGCYRELATLTLLLAEAEQAAPVATSVVKAPPVRLSLGRIVRFFNRCRDRWQANHVRARIQASGLFDPSWYIAKYPDVAASGIDPLEHYLQFGAGEGRGVGPNFDMTAYLALNPTARLGNPILHYLDGSAAAKEEATRNG